MEGKLRNKVRLKVLDHGSKVGEAPRQDEVVVAGSAETCARLGEFRRCGSGCWGSAKMNRRLGLGCHGDSARRKLGVAHTGKGRGDGLCSLLLAASKGARMG